ncbi:MAG TPA: baseplate J/gp47 family protein, partial [Pyrinomonadaceae bacterium]
LMPGWQERHAADLGVALVEVLAYVGDYLSYQQDAVATEAYLGTARRRVSVRRHARLVDYQLSDGSNARAWVQVRVASDAVPLDAGTQILTRVHGLPERIQPGSEHHETALNSRPVVFETVHPATLYQSHNEIIFHTWGEERCCLPEGATRATLRNDGERLQHLQVGDVLIFKEARNPQNGVEEEADPARRHAVRITKIKNATDPLVAEDEAGTQPLRVLEISWDHADALPFPLCLWDVVVGGDEADKRPAGIALGNIVLADHGLTVEDEPLGTVPHSNPDLDKIRPQPPDFCHASTRRATPPRFRPRLSEKDVTQAPPYDPTRPAAEALRARPALPQISLKGTLQGQVSKWMPKRDLLGSNAGKTEFVVETESDSTSFIRFGDERFASRPAPGTTFTATYRVGNGTRGNVGAETLKHVVTAQAAVLDVSNPMPAGGGAEAETLERARQDAPVAFLRQERAVTPKDYAEMAERHEGVQRAAATLRWTGSWNTVFLTIDRRGGLDMDANFEREMRRHLERFRMAGHDLEVDGPSFVSLEIEMLACVKRNYLASDVRRALLERFSNRVL